MLDVNLNKTEKKNKEPNTEHSLKILSSSKYNHKLNCLMKLQYLKTNVSKMKTL